MNANTPRRTGGHILFWAWVVLVTSVVVSAIALGPNQEHFWLIWETGALTTATIYTLFFYGRLFLSKDENEKALFQGLSGLNLMFLPAFCVLAVACLAAATVLTFLTSSQLAQPLTSYLERKICFGCNGHILPLEFLVIASILFCLIDLIFVFGHDNLKVQQEFRQGLHFNGVPVLVGFTVLLLFVCRFDAEPRWSPQLKGFIGGAVALETLVSNTMFAIMFWKPRATS